MKGSLDLRRRRWLIAERLEERRLLYGYPGYTVMGGMEIDFYITNLHPNASPDILNGDGDYYFKVQTISDVDPVYVSNPVTLSSYQAGMLNSQWSFTVSYVVLRSNDAGDTRIYLQRDSEQPRHFEIFTFQLWDQDIDDDDLMDLDRSENEGYGLIYFDPRSQVFTQYHNPNFSRKHLKTNYSVPSTIRSGGDGFLSSSNYVASSGQGGHIRHFYIEVGGDGNEYRYNSNSPDQIAGATIDVQGRVRMLGQYDEDGDGLPFYQESIIPYANPDVPDIFVAVDAMEGLAPVVSNPIASIETVEGQAVITSYGHGLATGARVVLAGLDLTIGLSEGNYPITRLDDDKFAVGSGLGNILYGGGGRWAQPTTLVPQPTGTSLDKVIELYSLNGFNLHIDMGDLSLTRTSWVTPSSLGDDTNANGILDPGEDTDNDLLLSPGWLGDQYGLNSFFNLYSWSSDNWAYPAAITRYVVFADEIAARRVVGSDHEHTGVIRSTIGANYGNTGFAVTLGAFNGGTADEQAAVFMHFLGKSLGLQAGGGDSLEFKPNYPSVVNSLYTLPNTRLLGSGVWSLGYSDGQLPDLDESALAESGPITSIQREIALGPFLPTNPNSRLTRFDTTGPVDLNGDGDTTDVFSSSVNSFRSGPSGYQVLQDFNDWENLEPQLFSLMGDENLTHFYADLVQHQELSFEELLRFETADPSLVSINDVSVHENAGTATFSVTLDRPLRSFASVEYQVLLGGTALSSDLIISSGTLEFLPGEMAQTLTVSVLDDELMEVDKTFVVLLDNPQGSLRIADDLGLGTILDDDLQTVEVSPSGLLDLSWDGDGVKVLRYAESGYFPRAVATVADGNGRVLQLSGNNDNFPYFNELKVARYLPNGSMDPTWGTDGLAVIAIPGLTSLSVTPYALSVYKSGPLEGRVLVAASSFHNGYGDFLVARLNRDGTLDQTYGNNSGYVMTRFFTRQVPRHIAIYETGIHADKFLVAGREENGMLVAARYMPDGQLDTTFAANGKLSYSADVYSNYESPLAGPQLAEAGARRVLIDQQDRILFVGTTQLPVTRQYGGMVARFTSNGEIDSTFGTPDDLGNSHGIAFLPFRPNNQQFATLSDAALQPDGKIVVVSPAGEQVFVARLTTNGRLDSEFVGSPWPGQPTVDGIRHDFVGQALLYGVEVQNDGKIVVVGNSLTTTYPWAARYNSDGSPDTTFDLGGDAALIFNNPGHVAWSSVNKVIQMPDGNLVLGGQGGFNSTEPLFTTTKVQSTRNDLSVTVSSDTSQLLSDGRITYTIRVNNFGDDAVLPFIKNTVATGMSLASTEVPEGWIIDDSVINGQIKVARRKLSQSEGEQVLVVTLQTDSNLTHAVPVSYTAMAGSLTLESNLSNNTANIVDNLSTLLRLSVLTTHVGAVEANQEITYVLCVTNDSPEETGYRLKGLIPNGVEFLSATGDYTMVGNSIEWLDEPSLTGNGKAHQQIVVRALVPGRFQLSASVLSFVPDATPMDNSVPTPNLVSYWKADRQGPVNVIYDSIGSNHGILATASGPPALPASLSDGYSGQAFTMNHVQKQFVDVPDSPTLHAQNFTISARFNSTSLNGVAPTIFSKTVGNGNLDSYSIFFYNGGINAIVSNATANNYRIVSIPFSPVAGQWYQTAMTFKTDSITNARTLTLYLLTPNGIQTSSTSVPFAVGYDQHPFRIGMDIENEIPSYFWNGKVDEVYFFNAVLKQSEIASLDLSDIVDPSNAVPTISSNSSTIAVLSGQVAGNTGTWNDLDGIDNCAFVTASAGSVIHQDGKWTWSMDTTGMLAGSHEVLITVNDGRGGISSTTFSLIVHAMVQAGHVYHANSSFSGFGDPNGVASALDNNKSLARESAEPRQLTYDNLINSSRGINGIVFDIRGLPGNLTASDFVFQMSPQGAFDVSANPPTNWQIAPSPISVTALATSPPRVVLRWPDEIQLLPNATIVNRWLQITVTANANTGLSVPEVFYIGHLLGETTGLEGNIYTVSFADITPIRQAVGQAASVGRIQDIDKNGTVTFADITAMRGNVGRQLSNITIPASAGGAGPMNVMPFGGTRDSGSSIVPSSKTEALSSYAVPQDWAHAVDWAISRKQIFIESPDKAGEHLSWDRRSGFRLSQAIQTLDNWTFHPDRALDRPTIRTDEFELDSSRLTERNQLPVDHFFKMLMKSDFSNSR